MSYLDEVNLTHKEQNRLENLKVSIQNDLESQRFFLESCVYEVDDAIAIITYISYRLDREDVPTYCRKWSAKQVDKSGRVKIRVEFERYF